MTTNITVDGMSCGGCEANVEAALESIEGVTGASADSATGEVTVEGDSSSGDLVAAVEDAGYSAQA